MAAPRIPADRPLAKMPLVPTKVHVSRPVEMRLESMVADLMTLARDLGAVTRGEVVGTLLLSRQADEALVAEVRRYRDSLTVGDALPGRKTISLTPRRRGRPVRRA